jgi:hypothetical protein
MNISIGNLISNSYSQGNIGKPISLHVFLLGAFFLATNSHIYESPRFPWEKLLEMRFPVKIFSRKPYIYQSFPKEPRGSILFEN